MEALFLQVYTVNTTLLTVAYSTAKIFHLENVSPAK